MVEALAPAWLAAAGEAATGLAAIVAGWAAVRGLDDWRREAPSVLANWSAIELTCPS